MCEVENPKSTRIKKKSPIVDKKTNEDSIKTTVHTTGQFNKKMLKLDQLD